MVWTLNQLARAGDVCRLVHVAAADGDGWAARVEAEYGERLRNGQVSYELRVLAAGGDSGARTSKSDIGNALVREAEAMHADVVVLASQTRGGWTELISGSVASRVVHECPQPVAVLHLHKSFRTGAALAAALAKAARTAADAVGKSSEPSMCAAPGGGHEKPPDGQQPTGHAAPPRVLMVAVAASDESEAACRWTLDNLYRPGDVVHLVHVIPVLLSSSVMPPFAGTVPTTLHGGVAKDRATQEAQLWRLRQLRRFSRIMDEAGAAYSFDTIVEYSQDPTTTVGDDLCHAAERLGAAALVLAAHKRGAVLELLFGSVSSHVAHHCSQPVIVLHPAETRGGS